MVAEKVAVAALDLADVLDRVERLPIAEQPSREVLSRLRSALQPKLNQVQEIALVLLAERQRGQRPMQTSNRNTRDFIAYGTARHLERFGLARIRGRLGPSGSYYEVGITDEGRQFVEGSVYTP